MEIQQGASTRKDGSALFYVTYQTLPEGLRPNGSGLLADRSARFLFSVVYSSWIVPFSSETGKKHRTLLRILVRSMQHKAERAVEAAEDHAVTAVLAEDRLRGRRPVPGNVVVVGESRALRISFGAVSGPEHEQAAVRAAVHPRAVGDVAVAVFSAALRPCGVGGVEQDARFARRAVSGLFRSGQRTGFLRTGKFPPAFSPCSFRPSPRNRNAGCARALPAPRSAVCFA